MKKTTKRKTLTPAKPAVKATKKIAAAPAVKKAGAKAVVTSISAQIDVGFGNALYIRGEGPGLSWEKGTLMTCVADDEWSIQLPGATKPVVCKFLLNDLIWSGGEDFSVAPGGKSSLVPIF